MLVKCECDAELLEAVSTLSCKDFRPFEAIVNALRRRVGTAIARVRDCAQLDAILSPDSIDPEFLAWVLSVADPVDAAVIKAVSRGLSPVVDIDVSSTTLLVKTLTTTMLRHEAATEVERFGTLAKRCEVIRIVLTKIAKFERIAAKAS